MGAAPDPAELNLRLRALPAVDKLAASLTSVPLPDANAAARRAIDEARVVIRSGSEVPSFDDLVEAARSVLHGKERSRLQRVVNATGVLVHTNLGRVPLGEMQLGAIRDVALGYSNLEYDLHRGTRGSRYSHAIDAIVGVTGAESALVVNNNAAAVLLVLAALCSGREVIISRGELIEIGGGFRIPDVMASAGVELVEVGTTNRTHLADYEKAISPNTAAILKVHPSNYQMVGFTASVEARDIARLSRGRGVCFINDLGSGLIEAPPGAGWADLEPPVALALSDGADLVTFSGDKLLGGPQAGIIAGRRELVEEIARHPLLRALRVDKLTLAALEATLRVHRDGRSDELPLWRMALASSDSIESRARVVARRIGAAAADSIKVDVVRSRSVTGGGSLPGADLPSWAVMIEHPERSTAELERALRYLSTPVIGRIDEDRLLLDLRTVPPDQDEQLADLVVEALT